MKRITPIAAANLVICCIAALLLTACGGGVDNGGSGSGANASGGTTLNGTVTTTVGQATIQKTFLPNVVIFPDTAPITEVSPGTFQINGVPLGFGVNSVFTWMDHPYVVLSATTGANGTMTVTTRDAQIDEVLTQLVVTGDLTIDDADLTRLVIADANNDSQTPVITTGASSARAVIRSTKVVVGPCKATQDDEAQGGATTISCSIVNVPVQSGVFVINGTAGVKDIKFTGLNINLAAGSVMMANAQGTPYFALSGQVATASQKPAEVKGDFEIFKIRLPILATLDYLNIDIPIDLSWDVPVYNVGVGVSGEFPYANGTFQPRAIAIQTPTATLATGQAFNSKITDAFWGLKTGVQLTVTKYPAPLAKFLNLLAGQWPVSDDRAVAAGFFGILGEYGSLSIALNPPSTTPCFNWALEPRLNGLAEVKLLEDPILSLDSTALTLSDSPTTGQSGCSSDAVTATITSASCIPSSRTPQQPVEVNNHFYWQVNGTGAASGPVGTQVFVHDYDGFDLAMTTMCDAWHWVPSTVTLFSMCTRQAGDPPSTTWTTVQNFFLDSSTLETQLVVQVASPSNLAAGENTFVQCPVHP